MAITGWGNCLRGIIGLRVRATLTAPWRRWLGRPRTRASNALDLLIYSVVTPYCAGSGSQ